MKKNRILVVDDDHAMRLALSESLESCGYDIVAAENGREALELFKMGKFDLVVTDMKMPGMTGIEVLRGVKELSPEIPVILITAYGTVGTAVEAMKEGAAEFIMKPFSLDDLEAVVKHVLNTFTKKPLQKQENLQPAQQIITKDQKFISIIEMLKNVAKSKSSIMIQGESGTGKELLAKYIHRHSNRRNQPFVAINCAAIPHNLLESEMFGYEKGAFTGASQRKLGKFELAHTGTLLLDEVSEMETHLQAKLLRVIQESEVDRLGGNAPIPVDVRIIATTNIHLPAAIENKTFRSDLYYRLNVIPVKIPPLRERNGDILYLTDHFLEKFAGERGRKKPLLSDQAATLLKTYHFPGNVRELENIIERAVLMTDGSTISPESLCLEPREGEETARTSGSSPDSPSGRDVTPLNSIKTLKNVEKTLICETLNQVDGNKTKAAKLLGISVRTLWNKVNEYGMADAKSG
ncbi:MAG: sigma-54-dependent Fis family transcriptional regulator [Syntrophaceae bacterium CG2_30_58_14]|nr:MAG: sigma-54-dependent Fis family transcriptional regulator [Syntrophaceae bacterium CG2_30_58_14]